MFSGFLCRDVMDDLIVLVKGIQLHSGQVEEKKREKKKRAGQARFDPSTWST